MNKKTVFLILALLAVIGLGTWLSKQAVQPAQVDTSDKQFSVAGYGINFKYPAKYMVVEKELGNAERGHKQIMLIEDTAENRALLAGELPGREGPVSVTLDIYQNLENESLENWVKGNNNSNYKLSADGALSTTTVSGREALSYSWDGLYRGDTVAMSGPGYIAAWSATYLEPADAIRLDFQRILQSISWSQ